MGIAHAAGVQSRSKRADEVLITRLSSRPLDPQLWAWVKACALNNPRPVLFFTIMRTDKGPAMTGQTRSQRTLQTPRGAAVTWGSRGMHVGNARQRQGWAEAAQGAHGSRQGTKCSQRRHDRTEPVRGYQPIEVPSPLAFQHIPLAWGKKKRRARRVTVSLAPKTGHNRANNSSVHAPVFA